MTGESCLNPIIKARKWHLNNLAHRRHIINVCSNLFYYLYPEDATWDKQTKKEKKTDNWKMKITFCEQETISHVVKESHFWVAQLGKQFASRTDLKPNHKSSLLNQYLISMMERFKQQAFLALPLPLLVFHLKRQFYFPVGASSPCQPLRSW